MTAFLALGSAVAARLAEAPALAGGRIRRGRNVPVPLEHVSAIDIHVQRSNAETEYLDGSVLRWETLVGIDLYARASAGVDAETAIDALLTDVFTRMGNATVPVGSISWTLDPAIQWDGAEADQTLAQASLALRVSHFTTLDLAAVAA